MDFGKKLLALSARRFRECQLPLLGDVRIQSLTRTEARNLRDSFTDDDGRPNERFKRANELLVAACVVDESGARSIGEDEVMHGAFDSLDDAAFTALYVACREHTNWMGSPDWSAVEDAAKN